MIIAEKCVIKQKLLFCFKMSKVVYSIIKMFIDHNKYYHDVYTEEVNKIPLSSNDDKRLQTRYVKVKCF